MDGATGTGLGNGALEPTETKTGAMDGAKLFCGSVPPNDDDAIVSQSTTTSTTTITNKIIATMSSMVMGFWLEKACCVSSEKV